MSLCDAVLTECSHIIRSFTAPLVVRPLKALVISYNDTASGSGAGGSGTDTDTEYITSLATFVLNHRFSNPSSHNKKDSRSSHFDEFPSSYYSSFHGGDYRAIMAEQRLQRSITHASVEQLLHRLLCAAIGKDPTDITSSSGGGGGNAGAAEIAASATSTTFVAFVSFHLLMGIRRRFAAHASASALPSSVTSKVINERAALGDALMDVAEEVLQDSSSAIIEQRCFLSLSDIIKMFQPPPPPRRPPQSAGGFSNSSSAFSSSSKNGARDGVEQQKLDEVATKYQLITTLANFLKSRVADGPRGPGTEAARLAAETYTHLLWPVLMRIWRDIERSRQNNNQTMSTSYGHDHRYHFTPSGVSLDDFFQQITSAATLHFEKNEENRNNSCSAENHHQVINSPHLRGPPGQRAKRRQHQRRDELVQALHCIDVTRRTALSQASQVYGNAVGVLLRSIELEEMLQEGQSYDIHTNHAGGRFILTEDLRCALSQAHNHACDATMTADDHPSSHLGCSSEATKWCKSSRRRQDVAVKCLIVKKWKRDQERKQNKTTYYQRSSLEKDDDVLISSMLFNDSLTTTRPSTDPPTDISSGDDSRHVLDDDHKVDLPSSLTRDSTGGGGGTQYPHLLLIVEDTIPRHVMFQLKEQRNVSVFDGVGPRALWRLALDLDVHPLPSVQFAVRMATTARHQNTTLWVDSALVPPTPTHSSLSSSSSLPSSLVSPSSFSFLSYGIGIENDPTAGAGGFNKGRSYQRTSKVAGITDALFLLKGTRRRQVDDGVQETSTCAVDEPNGTTGSGPLTWSPTTTVVMAASTPAARSLLRDRFWRCLFMLDDTLHPFFMVGEELPPRLCSDQVCNNSNSFGYSIASPSPSPSLLAPSPLMMPPLLVPGACFVEAAWRANCQHIIRTTSTTKMKPNSQQQAEASKNINRDQHTDGILRIVAAELLQETLHTYISVLHHTVSDDSQAIDKDYFPDEFLTSLFGTMAVVGGEGSGKSSHRGRGTRTPPLHVSVPTPPLQHMQKYTAGEGRWMATGRTVMTPLSDVGVWTTYSKKQHELRAAIRLCLSLSNTALVRQAVNYLGAPEVAVEHF